MGSTEWCIQYRCLQHHLFSAWTQSAERWELIFHYKRILQAVPSCQHSFHYPRALNSQNPSSQNRGTPGWCHHDISNLSNGHGYFSSAWKLSATYSPLLLLSISPSTILHCWPIESVPFSALSSRSFSNDSRSLRNISFNASHLSCSCEARNQAEARVNCHGKEKTLLWMPGYLNDQLQKKTFWNCRPHGGSRGISVYYWLPWAWTAQDMNKTWSLTTITKPY